MFARDHNQCVVCKHQLAVDAHHILDRGLFSDGGYRVDNGASVCEPCHIRCERCEISVETLRNLCGITDKVLPEGFNTNIVYNKWGKAMYYKYQRTSHFPYSDGITSDDRIISSLDQFRGKRVVVTMKMDGENTSIYRDHLHARSIDSAHHVSRDWIKGFASTFQGELPDGWRICGENLFATHSIHYNNLDSYFYGFSIWNQDNIKLGWDETLEWFALLGITPVQTLYDGFYDYNIIANLQYTINTFHKNEGFVMTLAEPFHYDDFSKFTAKYVRANHVRTSDHWKYQEIIPNRLKEI